MFFLPFSILLFLISILLLPFLFVIIQIEVIRIALGKLGLSPTMALLIFFLTLIGSTINIPLFVKPSDFLLPDRNIISLLQPFGLPEIQSKQIIAINLGGAIIPILLCIYLLPKTPLLPTLFSTLISIIVCFKISKVVPGVGIVIPSLIPPIIAVLCAYIFSPGNKIPVAYISGVLGVLIGADLLHLSSLGNYPGIMSIGGAGVFDGIFLVGIFSALLA